MRAEWVGAAGERSADEPAALECPPGHTVASGQRGMALIETLIAVVITGLIVGAVTQGILTSMRVSTENNSIQRAEVLLTSFGEVIKQLPYESCASPARYLEVFRDYEDDIDPAKRLERPPIATVDITNVECARTGSLGDRGFQEFAISATYGNVTRSGLVVKRDPNAIPQGVRGTLTATPLTPTRSPTMAYQLRANITAAPETGIAGYVWDCGDGEEPIVVFTAADPNAVCTFNAPSSGTQTYTVSLVVIDATGREYPIDSRDLVVETSTAYATTTTAAPVTTTTSPTSTSTTTTLSPTLLVADFRPVATTSPSASFGCCDTWASFQWTPIPGVTRYRITLEWARNRSIRFAQDVTTTGSGTFRYRFQALGLGLGSRYFGYIEAYIPNGSGGFTLGPRAYANGGSRFCLGSPDGGWEFMCSLNL